jgi:hypothetical protein
MLNESQDHEMATKKQRGTQNAGVHKQAAE